VRAVRAARRSVQWTVVRVRAARTILQWRIVRPER
jgi:hypothetical protein